MRHLRQYQYSPHPDVVFMSAPPLTIDCKKGSLFQHKYLRFVSSFCTTLPLTADLSVVVFDHQSDSQSITMFGLQLYVIGFASTLINAHGVYCA
jgi:hypothetical protein